MRLKVCTKCKIEKPYTAEYFFRRKDRPCGLMGCCKVCKTKAADDYWDKREGGRVLKNKRYWDARPGAYAAYQREQRKIKKDQYSGYERKRFIVHRAKRLACSAAWVARNPVRARLYQARHRSLKLADGGNVSVQHIESMLMQQNGRCYYCKIMLDSSYHLEHKIPLSRNGKHVPNNICLSCKSCNSKKGTLTANEFIVKMQRLSAQ